MLLFLVPVVFLFFRKRRKISRRQASFRKPFPPEWDRILDEIPLCRRLPQDLKKELRGHVSVFLSEKAFEGCMGQKISEDIKVKIAAHACMLLLNRDTDYFPRLSSVLVYPDAYWVNDDFHIAGQTIKGKAVNLGESWEQGAVILSWKKIVEELSDDKCGHSLALHEFAHQIDAEDGFLNGLPELGEGSRYGKWASVFAKEYENLRDCSVGGDEDVIDDYGAQDPAEFFAVVTEGFFLKSCEMKMAHPELYRELVGFYKVEPADWVL